MNYQKRTELILPEYGRNIQKMVDHALTLTDKTERTRCINTIIDTMGNLFPYLRDTPDFRHKLWDHLAIMANYQLDIESPYPLTTLAEKRNEKPNQIKYKNSGIKIRHYGRNTEEMINVALKIENKEEQRKFLQTLANYMKKSYLQWNKELVNDEQIINDIEKLSDGKINIITQDIKIRHSRDFLQKKKK